VYLGKFLAKLLLLLVVSILFALLVLALSEASTGAQTHLDMIPLVVLVEFGAFLEFTALTFFIGSFSRSGAMVLGVLIALLLMIAGAVLVLGFQSGLRESMFFVPAANAAFLFNVIPWYIVQPGGMMILQGYVEGAGPIAPVTVPVLSALEYVLAGLVVNIVVPVVAGYYLFRSREVKE
jgi:ABC-type transport system involved in multi-copper enzyme maturation permease subunit